MNNRRKKSPMPRSKGRNKGIKIIGEWKPISLDPSLFADEKMDEIICFEELTDYKIVKTSKELKIKGSKRKLEVGEDQAQNEDDEYIGKKKKRKKQKHRLDKKAEETDEEIELSMSEGEQEDVDENITKKSENEDIVAEKTQTKSSKKKKKRKTKKKLAQSEEAPVPKSTKKGKNWAVNASTESSDKNADISAWKNLYVPKPVLKALSYLGFSAPTPIQALALPSAIRDQLDILGAAETGSGKTLAFAIPMIHSILEWQEVQETGVDEEDGSADIDEKADIVAVDTDDGNKQDENKNNDISSEDDDDADSTSMGCVKVVDDVDINFNLSSDNKSPALNNKKPLLGLVVTPTRELAVQVKHHIDAVARFTGIKTAIVVGGMAPQKQERVLNRRPEIVIATPGRLWELIRERHPHLSNLKKLKCLVIDEADRMVEKGHYAELSQLLEMLSEGHYNPKRQTFVFSATLTLIHQAPSRLTQKKKFKKMDKEGKLEALMEKIGMKGKPKVIDLTRKQATVETLTETRIICTSDEKDLYLYYFLLQYQGRTMVFANSIDCIKRLCSLLTILECNPLPLHANMHQKQRLKNLERFAERESCVLLTTDVAARGLDIPNVQHVIHYQIPRTSETYVHRSGRTARASKDGLSLLIIGPDDMINFKKICRTLEKNDELPIFPVESKCMKGIKERVNLAQQIEKIEYFNSRAKHQNSWIQQAADALEIDLDDDDLVGGKDEHEERQKQKAIKMMKKQLKGLLSQPLFSHIMKTKYPTQSGALPMPFLGTNLTETALGTIANQKKKQKKKI
ncbi:ATP-dependent RNA helicase DDX24 [Bombina bombina]|uniref:ATP-dependent RNA helicase DDX24 n=1 Tax=Bombina bombina TaxID=8345 RepID=UPI00235B2846|nr:ATP-dependent RNA helicase DDX24 [Bombina bombina]